MYTTGNVSTISPPLDHLSVMKEHAGTASRWNRCDCEYIKCGRQNQTRSKYAKENAMNYSAMEAGTREIHEPQSDAYNARDRGNPGAKCSLRQEWMAKKSFGRRAVEVIAVENNEKQNGSSVSRNKGVKRSSKTIQTS